MPVTLKQVRDALLPEEPDYGTAKQLGRGALPHLEELVEGPDPLLASKAAYLTGLIGGPRATAVLQSAAVSRFPEVRVAAAAGAANLEAQAASMVLLPMLDDADVGVRKVALKSVPPEASAEVRAKVQSVQRSDPLIELRGLAGAVSRRLQR